MSSDDKKDRDALPPEGGAAGPEPPDASTPEPNPNEPSVDSTVASSQQEATEPTMPAGIGPRDWDWNVLYPAQRGLLAKIRRRYGFSAEECEDVFHTVISQVLARPVLALDPPGYLGGALWKAAAGAFRKKSKEPGTVQPSLGERVEDPRAALDARVSVKKMSRVLTPRSRQILQTYAIDGYSLGETAERLGLAEKGMWTRYNRCVEKLREIYAPGSARPRVEGRCARKEATGCVVA